MRKCVSRTRCFLALGFCVPDSTHSISRAVFLALGRRGRECQLINSSLEKWKCVSTMSARGATDGTESTNTKRTEISCAADIEKHTSLFFLAKVTQMTLPSPPPQRARKKLEKKQRSCGTTTEPFHIFTLLLYYMYTNNFFNCI